MQKKIFISFLHLKKLLYNMALKKYFKSKKQFYFQVKTCLLDMFAHEFQSLNSFV
jgi:hypothetical protein